jgi:hypothetical protein
MKIYKNVPAVIALALSLLAAIGFALILSVFDAVFAWANSSDNPSALSTWLLLASAFLAPLLAIFAAVSPALKVKANLTFSLVGAVLAIILVIDPLSNVLWSLQAHEPVDIGTVGQSFFPGFNKPYEAGRSLATVFGLLGAVALAIAFFAKTQPSVPAVNGSLPSVPQASPIVGAPTANVPYSSSAVSAFPTLTLVFAFFSPLLAVVLGHVTLNQMRRGLISSANVSTAKTGLTVAYVFIGLGFIAFIAWTVFLAALIAPRY